MRSIEEPMITPLSRGEGRTNSRSGSRSGSMGRENSLGRVAKQLSGFLGFKNEADDGEHVLGTMLFGTEVLNELMEEKSKAKLDEIGGVQAVARGVGSSLKRGLTGNDDVRRKAKYGTNKVERPAPATYVELFVEAMQDTTVLILLTAALISITLSIIVCYLDLGAGCPRKPLWSGPVDLKGTTEDDDSCMGWLDGAAILGACLLIGNITAWNEMSKEKQFRGLQAQQDDCAVVVRRNGMEVRVSAENIMVGDLVSLDTGAKVPADGILIKGNACRMDESAMTGESDTIPKSEEHPFIVSGSTVTDGDCTYLVVAVGEYSEWGRILSELVSERDDTPLQDKLTVLAEQIGYLGMAVALFCFIGQTIIWFIDLGRGTCFYTDITGNPLPREDCVLGYPGLDDRSKCELNPHRKWMTTWDNFNVLKLRDIVGFFIDSVTIIVVAVPEGLPLAVTIALAYSVKKMQADKNLVRVMAACETMGGCTNICSDKTGTLTQNQMNVTDGFFAGRASDGFLPTQAELSPAVLAALVESMAVNSKAHIGVDGKSGRPEVIGNKTEGSMLLFLRTLGVDYRTIREAATVRRTFPFSSLKKRMSTIVENEGRSKLLVKGASEVVMALCSHYMTENGTVKQMQEETRTRINQYISKMASQGLRTIALASKELADGIPTSEEELEAQERELCCICVLGIKDPLRKEVPDAVRQCQRAGITIRMLTGDALLTAKNIARECGILTDGTAIEGPDFRTKSPEEQREILRSLQVMARCSPSDKLTLVQRLKEMEEVVAVTGDGTNDAPALKEADVGLSMGIAGTSVAQEASDIVIMDDNFSSIVKSVLWGRSVYDNIRRFLQFQLTVNVVALFICMVGAITGFGTPLKPVQLLWVNLIMDTLGALALATEAPTPDLLQREPYGRNDRLINAHMYRNIAVQSIYQIIVQLGLLWFGARFILDCSDGFGTGGPCVPLKPNGMGKNEDGNYRDTVIYNSFVWMQLFNELNARRIYNEKNCLEGVFGNPIFCFIWIASAIVQFCSVQFGGQVFRTVPLDMYSWIACIAVGAFSLALGLFQRVLPPCGAPSKGSQESDRERLGDYGRL